MFLLYILIFGIFLALLEIEIEGEDGWAKNLPTWRKINHSASFSFLRNVTGYHTILSLMIFSINHIVFIGFYGYDGIASELTILAYHMFLTIYWDFLWFILNPYFTIKKFKKEHIPWYTDSRWLLGFPIDYWYTLVISASLALIAYGISPRHIGEYLWTFGIGGIIWLVIFFISPIYHRWYHNMRK